MPSEGELSSSGLPGGREQEAGLLGMDVEATGALLLVKQNYGYLGLFDFSGFILWAETFENLDYVQYFI